MRVYNMPSKVFEEIEEGKLMPHHLVVIEKISKDFWDIKKLPRHIFYVNLEKMKVGYGRIVLCHSNIGVSDFYFRIDGMTQKEIVERFLDVAETKLELKKMGERKQDDSK